MSVDYFYYISSNILILIYLLISVILGFKIILKYFKYKTTDFILVGVAWLLLPSPFLDNILNFFANVATSTPLTYQPFRIINMIGIALIFISILSWSYAVAILRKKSRKVRYIYVISVGLYSLIFIITTVIISYQFGLFMSITENPYAFELNPLLEFFIFSLITLATLSGLYFASDCLKTKDDPVIKLKGKFLLFAFLALELSMFMIYLFETGIIMVVGSIILSCSAVSLYFGFIMPEKLKNYFIKQ